SGDVRHALPAGPRLRLARQLAAAAPAPRGHGLRRLRPCRERAREAAHRPLRRRGVGRSPVQARVRGYRELPALMQRGGARGTARDIPSATVGRLFTYLRVLNGLEARGVERVSSDLLADEAHVSAFQVRKDLAYFGTFGTRGTGYTVSSLKGELKRILGLTRPWRVAIVGMGRLGQALADYPGLSEYDFDLVAAFDVDERKVGQRHGGVVVRHMGELGAAVAELGLEIVLLTV